MVEVVLARNFGVVVAQLPRFPKKLWEIMQIHYVSLIFHEKSWIPVFSKHGWEVEPPPPKVLCMALRDHKAVTDVLAARPRTRQAVEMPSRNLAEPKVSVDTKTARTIFSHSSDWRCVARSH